MKGMLLSRSSWRLYHETTPRTSCEGLLAYLGDYLVTARLHEVKYKAK